MTGPRTHGTCDTCGKFVTGERRYCGLCLATRMDNYRESPLNAKERLEDLEFMLNTGCGWGEITRRLGANIDTLYTACNRGNRPDLTARLRQLRGTETAA